MYIIIMIKLVHVKGDDMMKKLFISLLSVGMLLGTFGAVEMNNTGSPNAMEQTVHADTTDNDSRTINYEVYKENSNQVSPMNAFFNKTAHIYTNDDGTYKVVLTAKVSHVTGLTASSIDNQQPKESAPYNKGLERYVDISFNIKNISDLNQIIKGVVSTNLLNLNVDKQDVDFKFDSSTLDSQGTTSSFADSLNKITDAENDANTALNNAKNIVDDTKTDSSDNNIIAAPTTTSDTTTNNNNNDSKTVLKELTYKIAKNNGDSSLVSPYFTNTAKVMQNPDGTYYVEVTMKYPKKFGRYAIQINTVNDQKPSNLSFTSVGDSNYLKFDFPINKLTDLSKLIPGNLTLNVPDFGFLNKGLDFNLDFDSLNPSDLTKLMNDSNISGLLSDLSKISNIGTVKAASSDTNNSSTDTQKTATLPQTGNETNNILIVIGGAVLVLWFVLLKGTYFN